MAWTDFQNLKVKSEQKNKLKSIFEPCDFTCYSKNVEVQDVALPEDVLSRAEILSCCSMCGKTENLISYFTYSVCEQGDCADRYRLYHFNTGPKKDLSSGIPYIWQSKFSADVSYRKKHCLPVSGLRHLSCSFCGAQNSQVVEHPRIPKRYRNNTFCRNGHCFNSFVWMVDHIGYS
jgi:hypothetical protein